MIIQVNGKLENNHTMYRYLVLLSSVFVLNCDVKDQQFTLLSASKTGVKFQNILKETEDFNVLTYGYLYNGGGVAVGDVDNNGLEDLYFTGNMVASRLYLNQGNFRFKEVAESAGVSASGLWNTGTTMVDINADGWLDIFVCRSAAKDPLARRNLFFINNQDGTFTESAISLGLIDTGYTTQVLFFDYDRDNDLDIFLLNHSVQEYAGFGRLTGQNKNKKDINFGDKLYENRDGFFVDVTTSSGIITNVLGFGLGVAAADFNNDGWDDLYISNDYNEEDYLYINQKDKTFKEQLREYMDYTPLFSMGSDAADINNDGFIDILSLDMLPESQKRQKIVLGPDNYEKHRQLVESGFHFQYMRNMLQVNQNGSFFSEIGQLSGISNTDWSWAGLIADLDNDGLKDIFVSNGYKRDYTNMDFISYAVQKKLDQEETNQEIAIMELIEEIPSSAQENYVFRQTSPLKFKKMNKDWGFSQKTLSNGAVYVDLDNDGDLDLVLNNIENRAMIYRNNADRLGNHKSLTIKLEDLNSLNREGIGTKVTIYSDEKEFHASNQPVRGFQSSVTRKLHFGLGDISKIDSIVIKWADGQYQTLYPESIPSHLSIIKEINNHDFNNPIDLREPIFSEINNSVYPIRHKENNYVDFKRERLLPHYLSRQGPNVAVGDVNNDGREDIYLVGAKDFAGQLWIQSADGYVLSKQNDFDLNKEVEQTVASFFDADADGDIDLYIVSGGNEHEGDLLKDQFYLNQDGAFILSRDRLPYEAISGSCVKPADVDLDGDIDLFVGSLGVPGQYPLSEGSQLLLNDGKGYFELATNSSFPSDLGLVRDATWHDIDDNGFKDLIVVGHWMRPKVLLNNGGIFSESDFIGSDDLSSGLWNTIERGDFNSDGKMDFVLGNYGLNSQLKAPIYLVSKDFDANGSIDPILCVSENDELVPFVSKDDLQSQLAYLNDRYVSYSSYANQSIEEIFPEVELDGASFFEANNLETSILLSSDDGTYSLNSLVTQAQVSPMNAIEIIDFDGDSNLDIILGGNLFGTRIKLGRYGASKGELFKGDGQGNFTFIPYHRSGVYNQGEIRDIKATIINERLALLVANNDGPLKIYQLTK